MSSAWNLSTQQFRVLWQHFRGGDLPDVFVYQNEQATTLDDADGLDLRTRDDALATLTPDQEAMITSLIRATYRVSVLGVDSANLSDPNGHVRIVSGGQPGGYVTIAVQRPGPTPTVGGRVQIAQVPWSHWPSQLVRMLPHSPCAGHLPAVRGIDVEADDNAGADRVTFLVRGTGDRGEAHARRLLTTPARSTNGVIEVTAGTIGENVPVQYSGLRYRDEPDDGRYVYTRFHHIDCVPADPQQFAALILKCLRTVKERRDDFIASHVG